MKFIEKTLEDPRTGAASTHHAVTGLNVEYLNKTTLITIASYVSTEKKAAGKEYLSINTFTLNGVPDWTQVPYVWALNQLVKPIPEDFTPDNYYGYVSPHLFAEGKIKESEV